MAHVGHVETAYDEFLAAGYERWEAREMVRDSVEQVL